jgi:hypothetical protein
MKRFYIVILLLCALLSPITGSSFEEVKARTSSKNKMDFPDDALSSYSTIFAFVLSNTREGGERQQSQLLQWHTSLLNNPSFPENVQIYHFPVIAGAPGFVKGFIRNGLGETYEEVVNDDNVAVLFVDDAASFATKAGLPFNNDATIVVVDNRGNIKGYTTGEVSNEKMNTILTLL